MQIYLHRKLLLFYEAYFFNCLNTKKLGITMLAWLCTLNILLLPSLAEALTDLCMHTAPGHIILQIRNN